MTAKLGPKFALKARFVAEWNTPNMMQNSQCVVEDQSSWAWLLEIYSETFMNQLSESADEWHWIYLAQVLKEDEESLFAFESIQQRNLFILMKELPSIGPKKAASILGKLGVDGIRALLFGENPKMFKVSGVGPKSLAQVAQGMQNAKEKFLTVLDSETQKREVQAEDTIKVTSKKVSQKTPEVKVEKSRITLSPSLLKGLERLGIESDDAFSIYRSLISDGDDLTNIDQAQLLQKILQKWGSRNVRRTEIGDS